MLTGLNGATTQRLTKAQKRAYRRNPEEIAEIRRQRAQKREEREKIRAEIFQVMEKLMHNATPHKSKGERIEEVIQIREEIRKPVKEWLSLTSRDDAAAISLKHEHTHCSVGILELISVLRRYMSKKRFKKSIFLTHLYILAVEAGGRSYSGLHLALNRADDPLCSSAMSQEWLKTIRDLSWEEIHNRYHSSVADLICTKMNKRESDSSADEEEDDCCTIM